MKCKLHLTKGILGNSVWIGSEGQILKEDLIGKYKKLIKELYTAKKSNAPGYKRIQKEKIWIGFKRSKIL